MQTGGERGEGERRGIGREGGYGKIEGSKEVKIR